MKTNKDERNAIATKFYKRMEEQVPVKQAELEKSSLFKEATRLSKEINKLNKKSQEHMAQCILAIRERLEGSGMPHAEIVEMLGNPDAFAVTNTDFEKKRRARAAIPYYERCSGKKADSDQCTRRRQQQEEI